MIKAGGVPLGRVLLFVAIALGGAAFDLATKSIIFATIGEPGSPTRTIIPDILELQTSYNPGALWGFMRGWAGAARVFAGLSVFAGVAIVYYLFFLGAANDRRLTIALGLIMAGAIGNCYDRLAFGRVRDFVHFHVDKVNFDCAIFNFADNMLVIGAIVIMFIALRPESASARLEPAAAALGEEPVRAS